MIIKIVNRTVLKIRHKCRISLNVIVRLRTKMSNNITSANLNEVSFHSTKMTLKFAMREKELVSTNAFAL